MASGDNRRARIGVIGTGWWATQAHLPSLCAYPAAQIVAVADPDSERLAAAGDAFDIRRRYTDYTAMLDDERLDGVIVATPHATHFPVAKAVLEHRLGLLLEKPMVLRAPEARELVELAQHNHAPLIVGYPWHFVAQHQRLRELIAAGRLGELQLVSNLFGSMVLEYLRGDPLAYRSIFNWPVTGPRANTYSEPRIAGGGQGVLQVTHAAGLLLWLTGLEPLSVGAFMENCGLQVDLVDALSLRFRSGALGTVASTGGIPKAQSANQQLEYRIYGSEGYALLDAMAGTCSIFDQHGNVEQLEQTPAEQRYPQALPARHLVDVLLDRAPNRSDGELGWHVVELLDAAYRSAAQGRIVHVDELYSEHAAAAISEGSLHTKHRR